MGRISGPGVPGKKRPYGTEYIDTQSGLVYSQTASPSGSDWKVTTPVQDDSVDIIDGPNLLTGENSVVDKGFDNKAAGFGARANGEGVQANADFSYAKGLGTIAGNEANPFLVVPGDNYLIIPEVDVVSNYIIGGTLTLIDSNGRKRNLDIKHVFTGGTTGVTTGITIGTATGTATGTTTGTTTGVTSAITVYTFIENLVNSNYFSIGSFFYTGSTSGGTITGTTSGTTSGSTTGVTSGTTTGTTGYTVVHEYALENNIYNQLDYYQNLDISFTATTTGITVTGITTGYTTGVTTGITTGLTLYTAIELEESIDDTSQGYIVDTSIGVASSAEGMNTNSCGTASHAEGSNTKACGIASHAEGIGTVADGTASHAGGVWTKAIHTGEIARSSNFFAEKGDSQYSTISLSCVVDGDEYTELFVDGLEEVVTLDINSSNLINIHAVAVVTVDNDAGTEVGQTYSWNWIGNIVTVGADSKITLTKGQSKTEDTLPDTFTTSSNKPALSLDVVAYDHIRLRLKQGNGDHNYKVFAKVEIIKLKYI